MKNRSFSRESLRILDCWRRLSTSSCQNRSPRKNHKNVSAAKGYADIRTRVPKVEAFGVPYDSSPVQQQFEALHHGFNTMQGVAMERNNQFVMNHVAAGCSNMEDFLQYPEIFNSLVARMQNA